MAPKWHKNVCMWQNLVRKHIPFTHRDRPTLMMAHSLQTRIVGKVDGQFLHACWWLWSLIPDAHTLLHFGQTKVWPEDNWDAAHSFHLLHLSFVASCLSASNLQMAFLTDEHQLSWSEACCGHE